VVGFDFEQSAPEGSYSGLETYDSIIVDILTEFPGIQAVKLYQAGVTRDHKSRSIQTALRADARRIANSCNPLQFTEMVPRFRQVCFEFNPVFQFLSRSSGREDFRFSVAAVMLGLSVPVTIGCDYSGLLGLDGCSLALALTVLGSNWSLRELKLTFLHSLDHSASAQGQKSTTRRRFTEQWSKWVNSYLAA
jgi:hypothetical protein